MTNFAIPPAIAGTTAVLAAVIGHVNVAFGQDGQMYTDASLKGKTFEDGSAVLN